MALFQDLLAAWLAGTSPPPPVVALLGMRLAAWGDGTGEVVLEADQRHHNAMGTLHGGILCDLADVAMGVAVASQLDDGVTFTTVGLNAAYFRPIVTGRLTARAAVLNRGRSTAYVECDVVDDAQRLVAKVTSTCVLMARKG